MTSVSTKDRFVAKKSKLYIPASNVNSCCLSNKFREKKLCRSVLFCAVQIILTLFLPPGTQETWLFFGCPSLLITLYLPCPALIDHFNPIIFQCLALCALHLSVPRPVLSHTFFLWPRGCNHIIVLDDLILHASSKRYCHFIKAKHVDKGMRGGIAPQSQIFAPKCSPLEWIKKLLISMGAGDHKVHHFNQNYSLAMITTVLIDPNYLLLAHSVSAQISIHKRVKSN